MRKFTGELYWPDPNSEDNNHQQKHRRRYRDPEAVACDLYGAPLAPQDYGADEGEEEAERELGKLYQLIFDRPSEGLKPEWQKAWELTSKRNEDGTVQVERVTNYPLLWSLRDVSSELHAAGVSVSRGVNAGKGLEPQQVKEWRLRVGLKAFVERYFKERREVLDAYLVKRKEWGERDILPDELLQRFVDGVTRLLAGQKYGAQERP